MSIGGSVDREVFEGGFRDRVDHVYDLGIVDDHRRAHGWVTGCLGDVFAPVWFVAENPSLKQVERIVDADRSPELQWTMTPGDKLFRQALFDNGFKAGDSAVAPGDWRCYVTDVVKSAAMVGDWNDRRSAARAAAAEAWAPVLEWELQCGRPRIVVTVGRRARQMLRSPDREGAPS